VFRPNVLLQSSGMQIFPHVHASDSIENRTRAMLLRMRHQDYVVPCFRVNVTLRVYDHHLVNHYFRIFISVQISNSVYNNLHLGHAAAKLVQALHYKPEGRGFDSR
jgi:hypothetical protein